MSSLPMYAASSRDLASAAADRLTIAHVGHTGTDADRDQFLAMGLWLQRNDEPFYRNMCEGLSDGSLFQDAIDLNGSRPRDFLTEQCSYDIVVTHNLWGLPERATSSATACSPHHSPERWRRRFETSGARYIFMFGSDFNAGSISRTVPGYQCFSVPAVPLLNVFAALGSCQASDTVTQAITYRDMTAARLRALPQLRTNVCLDLSYTEVRGEDLALLKEAINLKELRLVGTRVSDAAMTQVAQSAGIESLNLDRTGISNAGLEGLGRLEHLECLSLNHTRIDDAGVRYLRRFRNLRWFSAVGTALGDGSVVHLRELKNLRTLSLADTGVTARAVQQLRTALPGCTIYGAE
jgi:hypothetical protein